MEKPLTSEMEGGRAGFDTIGDHLLTIINHECLVTVFVELDRARAQRFYASSEKSRKSV